MSVASPANGKSKEATSTPKDSSTPNLRSFLKCFSVPCPDCANDADVLLAVGHKDADVQDDVRIACRTCKTWRHGAWVPIEKGDTITYKHTRMRAPMAYPNIMHSDRIEVLPGPLMPFPALLMDVHQV